MMYLRLDPEPRLTRLDLWCRPFVASIRRTVISSVLAMVLAIAAATMAGRWFELDPVVFAVFGACYAGALVFAMLRARQHWLGWYAWYDREALRRRNVRFSIAGIIQRDVQ